MAKYAFIVSSHRLASSSLPEKFPGSLAFNSGMSLSLSSSMGGSGFCWRLLLTSFNVTTGSVFKVISSWIHIESVFQVIFNAQGVSLSNLLLDMVHVE